jgi:hypothetical protein
MPRLKLSVKNVTVMILKKSLMPYIGAGMSVKEEDKCEKCKGEKYAEEKAELEVKLEPGVTDGYVYTFEGEGNQIVLIC